MEKSNDVHSNVLKMQLVICFSFVLQGYLFKNLSIFLFKYVSQTNKHQCKFTASSLFTTLLLIFFREFYNIIY